MRIAILDDYLDCALQFAPFENLKEEHELSVFTRKIPYDKLPLVLADFQVLLIMRERTAFPREVIRKLPNLKLIVTTGRRNDAIDVEACKEAGVTVCGTDSLAFPTAELALGLIMAAAKGLVTEHNSMREGGWQTALAGDLRGATLGIIGLGRLGGTLAGYGNALGMHILAWSRNLTADRAKECGAEFVSKDELMSRSDFISIHLRLSERTHHLIQAADIARMKQGAWLVNTSRAQIVEQEALLKALKAGAINAALDVFETEPPPEDDELRRLPNVLLSPHKGYASRETFRLFYQDQYRILKAWLAGQPENLIT